MVILLTWVGLRDPRDPKTDEEGPILTFLKAWRTAMDRGVGDDGEDPPPAIDRMYLFTHVPVDSTEHLQRARSVQGTARRYFPEATILICPVALARPIDDDEVYRAVKWVSARIVACGEAALVPQSEEETRGPARPAPDPAWQALAKEWFILVQPGTPAMTRAWIALAQEGHLGGRQRFLRFWAI